jgi:Tfp pilus assembly protein PilF
MGRLALFALAAVLSGCAALEAHVTLVEGLRQFDAGEHGKSAASLQKAIGMGLGDKDRATAYKHLAFIQCSAGRERPCRDEFRKALAADPQMRLDDAEAGHPVWGPIFRSMSGPGSLAIGLKQYEEGNYEESAKSLQGAIDLGVPDRERADAHKHLAFIHCSSNRERACREEFRKALAVNPALELAPAEAGHPVWGPIFRALKAGR